MSKQTDKPSEQKPERTLGDNLQDLFETFKRAEISLPQAIIIAAIVIALGIIFS
jgi:multisubunit Na+/H+ antiporter MnhC subunit